MQAVLVMFRSDGERRSFSLTRDVTMIGRRDDADLRIPVGDVSRKHARLIRDPDGMRIEDLGSSNGTYLNGQRVEVEAALQPGDSIQVGPVVFVLQVDGYPADEELHPVTAESAAAGAMFGGGAAGMAGGAAAAGAMAGDDLMDLEPLPADALGDDGLGDPLADPLAAGDAAGGYAPLDGEEDLMSAGGEPPAGDLDELQPLGDDAVLEEVALEDVALEDDALGGDDAAGGPPPPQHLGAISLADDDESIQLGDAPPAPAYAPAAPIPLEEDDGLALPPHGEALALSDDESLQPAGQEPIELSDDDLGLELASDPNAGTGAGGNAGGAEPIALGDDAALELLDEDPQSTPPHGDPLAIDLDEPHPGNAKR
jgi:hypothetical protein